MPVRFLSDAELARLSGWPDETAAEDLVTFFTLSPDDLAWLADSHLAGLVPPARPDRARAARGRRTPPGDRRRDRRQGRRDPRPQHRGPRPGRPTCQGRPPARDICPDTGRARLGYDRARVLLDRYTSPGKSQPGWDLHQLRHRGARTAMRYVEPSAAAVAEVTRRSRM